jgi:phosphatidylserine decarboxylase
MVANPEFATALDQSFDLAYATGLEEFKIYNINNLQDYLRYMDEYVYWIPTEDRTGTNVYYHICMFYFIIDLPPVSQFQSPIDPSSKSPWRWLSDWLIRYAQDMGKWMDTPESITPESLLTFYEAPSYHMQDYPVPEGGWKTFNEFFARHIDPALRPVAPGDNVVVSPADCAYDGQWEINDPEANVTTFDVKGVPWDIGQLLADETSGTDYGPLFAGGVFTHSFLAPNDYHRQHAPVEGRVIEAKVIPGICYLEVILDTTNTGTEQHPRLGMHRRMHRHKGLLQDHIRRHIGDTTDGLDAPDSPGYQFLQARGLVLIDNPIAGLVAVLPIGMAQVSSVVLSVKPGDYVQKGQEISCFQLGGSDIVMVFQKGANVKLDQVKGQHYNYGTAVGTVGTA